MSEDFGKSELAISPDFQYYQCDDDAVFPITNYFTTKFGVLPKYYKAQDIRPSFINALQAFEYELIWSHNSIVNGVEYTEKEVYKKGSVLVSVLYIYKEQDPFDDEETTMRVQQSISLYIFYADTDEVKDVIEALPKFRYIVKRGGEISLISQNSNGGLSTMEYSVPKKDMDIALLYGKSFLPVYDKIISRLNEKKGKGLVLFHGIPGSGKTSLVRHIATQVKKEVLFFPPHLVHNISDPGFLTFLMKHSNSIIIIEDAEKVILSRESSVSNDQAVSNILNITDGILSDCLGIQVIATFNTDKDRIDKALLRKGRLIAEFKFDKLDAIEASLLFKHLGKDTIAKEPMSLTDIFNNEEEVNVVQQERRSIGFGARQ